MEGPSLASTFAGWVDTAAAKGVSEPAAKVAT